ncbi:transglutaminase-like domain-containing protein [Ruania halotolerans]|uniref:transglutaminase-like domain-containing protein n=1 Tax=Ruania halotolerans TaxID=2897773 RepID=UPI001E4739F3|nr:transglutaminase family protein [Ruania halotolerans]UFU05940.1 transglutaminase family protein [Ruania halotolerans]
MRRTVTAELNLTAAAGSTQLAMMIAVARVPGLTVDDELEVRMDGAPVPAVAVEGPHFGLLHLVDLDRAESAAGAVTVHYQARVDGDPAAAALESPEPGATDLLTYLRPSRYAESDELFPTARREFAGAGGLELVHAVTDWAAKRLYYVPGSSRVTDGAVSTYLQGQGVCRDYAHLVVAVLRAMDVPARLAAVYAPGLRPMDFHAVAEAWVDGHWHVVDATRLAPRLALLRVATGRDAADTAFLSAYGAGIQMGTQAVTAVVEGDLPVEDRTAAVRLP